MSGIGSYSIQPQKRLYLNPIAAQSLLSVKTGLIHSIGTKKAAVSMPLAVGVAQFNLSFLFLIGVT